MKIFIKCSILLAFLSAPSIFVAQELGIQLSHKNGNRKRLIKEGSRIKIITSEGKKHKGRFNILNDSTIAIKGIAINLNTIELVRRKPLAVKIVKSVFIGIGSVAIVTPIFIGANGIAVIALIGAGLYTNLVGFTIPEFFVQTRRNTRWSYTIVPI